MTRSRWPRSAGWPSWGHGANVFEDTTRLHTGNTDDGEFKTGPPAHGGILEPGSETFDTALGVYTGGEADLCRGPVYERILTGRGVTYVQTGWVTAKGSVSREVA